MNRTRTVAAFAATALGLLALVVAGCHESVVAPRPHVMTLASLWPSQDGRSWSYQVLDRTFAGGGAFTTYTSAGAVPPAPSMTEVAALLDTLPAGDVYHADSAAFGLRFAGTITTLSGVTRQNLVETLVSGTTPLAPRNAAGGADAFLAQLYRARPDLRVLLRARLSSATGVADTVHTYASTLLHGYAWEKTTQWIGTYGDVDTLLAWKYLTAHLSPGSEFDHQLVPSLAGDVWLHGRILDRRSVRTPAGTFANAVVCAYLIDFGITGITGEQPIVTAYTRLFNYGYVAYVDNVGPVACYERRMVSVGGISHGDGDVTLGLTAQGTPLLALTR